MADKFIYYWGDNKADMSIERNVFVMEQIFQYLTDLMNETAELYMNGNPIVFVGVNFIFLCFAALLALHIIAIVKKCSQVATRKRICELVSVDPELIKQLQITRYKHPIHTNKLLHHRERWTYERKDGSVICGITTIVVHLRSGRQSYPSMEKAIHFSLKTAA